MMGLGDFCVCICVFVFCVFLVLGFGGEIFWLVGCDFVGYWCGDYVFVCVDGLLFVYLFLVLD